MKHRVWLTVLVLYLAAAAADTGYRILEVSRSGLNIGPGTVAVAFCAGLFWPIDLVARPLLTPR
ncbi:MAG TPA: hypothetical protein VLX67_06395 [Stellaceae bacterium]|nr:hypothetical protein [Stellaceae bacterium]